MGIGGDGDGGAEECGGGAGGQEGFFCDFEPVDGGEGGEESVCGEEGGGGGVRWVGGWVAERGGRGWICRTMGR